MRRYLGIVCTHFFYNFYYCLRDYNPAVRETAASAIGKIGMPEGIVCLEKIIAATNDPDVNVKTKAIWALGKLAPGCDTNAIYSVLESLKSNIWKVKMSCLVTITAFGDRCTGIVLPTLRKMLKDCTIHKVDFETDLMNQGFLK